MGRIYKIVIKDEQEKIIGEFTLKSDHSDAVGVIIELGNELERELWKDHADYMIESKKEDDNSRKK